MSDTEWKIVHTTKKRCRYPEHHIEAEEGGCDYLAEVMLREVHREQGSLGEGEYDIVDEPEDDAAEPCPFTLDIFEEDDDEQ